MDRCKMKKHYDTEFEAVIGAAKSETAFNAEMKHYPCGAHWHITHKEKSLQGKYRRYYRCPHCKQTINQKKNPGHHGKCRMKP